MELGSSKSKDGVPVWNGEASSYQDYEEAALLREQSIAVQKRYLCGPRLAAELGGSAKRLVVGKKANWLSHNNGVAELLQHLRTSLGRPQVAELTDHLSKYFKGSRKRPTEGMNDYITRKSEVYLRACQALRRVAPHQGRPSNHAPRMASRRSSWDYSESTQEPVQEAEAAEDNAEASTTTASTSAWETGNHDWNPYWQHSWWGTNWQWGYQSYGNSYTSWWDTARHVPDDPLPDLLPDYVQGWYLLHDSGLDQMAKNMITTAVQGDFSFAKIAQELRNQYGDGHQKRDYPAKNAGYMGEHLDEDFDHDAETYLDEDTEEMDQEEAAMWNEAESDAQEALVIMQNAKKTLREARQKQHAVKMARQYYKPSAGGAPKGRGRGAAGRPPTDDSRMTCLRCGKVGHRAANCDLPPLQAAKQAEDQGNSSSFVCFSNAVNQALRVGLSTEEAVARGMAVVDGGATKTLSSIQALENIMKINVREKGHNGLLEVNLEDRPVFSFGNGTQDQCSSTVKLKLQADDRSGALRVHCLDKGGGPLLLSIDALRRLDAIIDCRP